MHLLVLVEAEFLELTVFLHGHELVVGDSALETGIVLFLQGEEVGQIFGCFSALCSSGAVLDTEVPDLINISLIKVEGVEA